MFYLKKILNYNKPNNTNDVLCKLVTINLNKLNRNKFKIILKNTQRQNQTSQPILLIKKQLKFWINVQIKILKINIKQRNLENYKSLEN